MLQTVVNILLLNIANKGNLNAILIKLPDNNTHFRCGYY